MFVNLNIFLLIIMKQVLPGFGDETLQLVQILVRHGDRNPLTSYPTDPHADESNWPEGYAQLTNIGKIQLFEFGEYLRSRYDGFLNKTYHSKETLVWSSDTDRTIMSAIAALAGLYPPIIDDEFQKWNSVTNFQIVPVHTLPVKMDRMLSTERESCPNFRNVLKNFIKSSKYMQDLNKESKPLYKALSANSGLKINILDEVVYKLHDTLYVQELRNMSMPNWVTPLMKPDSDFKKLVQKCYNALSFTPELKRLYSGELLKELLKNMKDKVIGESQLRLVMFSGHDLTITNLMNTIGIYSNEIPPYASSLLFELHKTQESFPLYTVKIFYRNETNREPYELNVEECGTPCELERLQRIMSSSISENWDEECQLKIPKPLENSEAVGSSSRVSMTSSLFPVCLFTIYVLLK